MAVPPVSPAPGASRVDAARAQHLEALGRDWAFELGGEVFALPREISRGSARGLRALGGDDLGASLELLLGEAQSARLRRHRPSPYDVEAVLASWGRDTGLGLGEGCASACSWTTTPRRSKPRCCATTAWTSWTGTAAGSPPAASRS
ncbi:hypothetical protein A8W25_13710 [Streptomyces sp. ERV7]|uniref:hypothetical protein n=1 Tax=Streptomyces sp. ERV7 TaxID=1322334 RepID=UPI0007F527A7|nr:hypothetical protein [Streptomyces sp. ERV7]OAR23592.1 hypothetical protein A8W25_13710 [Streptomyces sp. ERV7]